MTPQKYLTKLMKAVPPPRLDSFRWHWIWLALSVCSGGYLIPAWILHIVLFYLLVVRPQERKLKRYRNWLLAELQAKFSEE